MLVDITVNGIYRSPSHFGGRAVAPDPELVGVQWSMMDYGMINVGMIVADVSNTQVTYLQGLADVIMVPANIDTTLGAGQLTATRNALESKNIPADWVNTGDTYRSIIREIMGYFQFMQRYTATTFFNPIANGVSLDTTMGNPALNNWQAMKTRWNEIQATVRPKTPEELAADEILIQHGLPITPDVNYDYGEAMRMTMDEANLAGLSQANCLKAALIMIGDDMGYDVSAVAAGTTLRGILRGLANQNDLRQFLIGGITI